MICGAHLLQRARQHALDGAVGADRHEDRRLDDAVVERRAGRGGRAPSVASRSKRSMRSIVSARVSRDQQHRVAVAEEAVARVDRVAVQRHHVRVAGEGGDEHQQRAARQVEVGDQAVDDAELEARRDEDVGLAAHRLAACRRAPPTRARARSSCRRRRRGRRAPRAALDRRDRRAPHLEPLAVHAVLARCRPRAPAGRCPRRRAA